MATTPHVLLDRYEVGRLLGAGGMAEVFEGRDRLLARRVAIKVLQAQFARDPSFLIRFKREAQAAASLSHPNIVGVYDTGTEDGTHFIVMEYVEGRTLKDVIRAEGPLYPERAAEVCADVCSALIAAHARGLIHRDIKPGNVMLTPEGKVKVMDFGIARATTSETITQTAAVVGTAQYISPEQAQGQTVDYRSDLYSVGCCLYEMLTGTVPFTGATPVAIAYRHVREDPTPPRMLNPDVPAPLEAITLKAMAKLPDNRYQTAAEMHDDLERFRNGQPVHATPLMNAAATTQAIPRDGGADPTAMLGTVPADRAARYAEPEEEERRTSVGWIVVSLLALVVVGLAAFFITRAVTGNGDRTATTLAPTTVPPTTRTTEDRTADDGSRRRPPRRRPPPPTTAHHRRPPRPPPRRRRHHRRPPRPPPSPNHLSSGGGADPETGQPVPQQLVAGVGEDRLGVELDALDRVAAVAQGHDQALGGLPGHLQHLGEAVALHHQGVVAGGGERCRQPGQHPGPLVVDGRGLAVDQLGSAADPGPVDVADDLVAEADAEDGQRVPEVADDVDRQPGVARVARPGRDQHPVRVEGANVGDGPAVVAPHLRLRSQLAQVLDQVEDERVVVVDDQDPQAPARVAQLPSGLGRATAAAGPRGAHGVSAPLSAFCSACLASSSSIRARRRTLPIMVLGSSSRNSTTLGTL